MSLRPRSRNGNENRRRCGRSQPRRCSPAASSTCVAGRYAEALHYSTEATRLRPGFQGAQRLRCAILAQTGRLDEARSQLAMVRRDQPHLTSAWIRTNVPYQTPKVMDRYLEEMRKAGLDD